MTSPLQTWALMDSKRSKPTLQGNNDDVIMDWLSTLTPEAAASLGVTKKRRLPEDDASTGVTSPDSASSSSSSSLAQPSLASTGIPDFYRGGAGLSPGWTTAASTGIGALGQLAELPGPITSMASKIAGAALGQEGLNGHTVTNGGFDIGASILGLGIPSMLAKLGGKVFGYEYDPANFLGEITNSPGLMSPRTLNLKAFERGSGDAFTGLNQQTLAEMARQEERNAAEHAARNKADQYAAEQDAQTQARADAIERRTSALNQLAMQTAANQAAMSSSGAAPSPSGSTGQSGGNTGRFGSAIGPGSAAINAPASSTSTPGSWNNYSGT